ncbi:serine hydrolase domain-containing protein [Hyphomonas sp. FCG-A18]|uniref:serine hydrolase domain-containing protein n=1 Tax=Hyphomonas sp. FCG-A18 TaxID=3080019 RepID=UPI002B3018B7|nr:serine hydrolase domain-containing protein [Hyphomonas sp. FCG-A18]
MSLSRRTALALIPSGVLAGACGGFARVRLSIAGLVEGPPLERAPAAGYVLMQGGKVIASEAVGEAIIGQRAFTIRSPFRAASVSKLVTTMVAQKLHNDGVLDLDAPLALSDEIIAPALTLRSLLSHTSGISDPDVYWLAHPKSIEPLVTRTLLTRKTDASFEYCNLGYGIAATVMEDATGRRFDHLARNLVLARDGLDAGFNWSGVSPEKRATGAALYRENAAGWQTQTDGPDILRRSDPAILLETGASLSTYTPGLNGTLFSPQGGLRASLLDLATIAGRLKYSPELTRPVWTLNEDASNGLHDQRYFTQFGTGVHIHPAAESLWPGQTLWGHHGEAYGLYSGAWYAPDLDLSFAYAVTGTPETPPARSVKHPALNTFTEALMDAVLAAYENSPAAR